MGIVSADFGGRRIRRQLFRWVLLLVLVAAIFWWLPAFLRLYTNWLWFKFDVRLPSVFWAIIKTKVALGLVFGLAFFLLVIGNVELARRFARRTLWYDEERVLRQRIAEAMEYFAGRYLYLALAAFTLIVAYGVAVGAAGQWNKYLLFQHGLPFDGKDPVFHRDIGFYVFRLPFYEYLYTYLMWALFASAALSAAAHYFDKAIRVLRGIPAFAPHVKSHLSILVGLMLVVYAFHYRLASFTLLYSPRGATFGASYADVHARLLAYNVLFIIAIACAALLLINIYFRGLWLPLAGIGFLAVSSLLLNIIYPTLVQRFQVIPNEFEREKEYIAHTVAFTRKGFNLDQIEQRTLLKVEPVEMDQIKANVATVENLRLWDYRPLLETFQQQQALWPYYRFNSVDIDRYWINGSYRQVMLAPRELWVPGLPIKGWQNEHVFNTHGYGLVMAPVSDIIQSGLPNLVVKNIPPQTSFDLKIERPAIYYGELTNGYVLVGTTMEENDYPLAGRDQMAKVRYQGKGGVSIGSALPRLAASVRFQDINLLISPIVTKNSRIMWGRNIAERAREVAPFLSYDRDPYIVAANDGHLYWIQDAYTTTDMYPYSDPAIAGFNYVRNSVKVVVDAYDGAIRFFIADDTDPIIRTYDKIFPGIFRPMSEMPADLLQHIRYPEALFNIQSIKLTIYHMTDPRTFYNKIEQWDIAREAPKSVGPSAATLMGRTPDTQGETMQAYYAIVKLPGAQQPEFILMLPFTPKEKPNMVAWLAARSDGASYSKLLLYNYPKTEQVWGPIQIEASISQDPDISEKISLWNQQGSAVIQGNLLVIPTDNSVLYVEPIYLKAAQSPIPELKRIVLARGDGRVVMRPSLTEALEALLGESAPPLALLQPIPFGQPVVHAVEAAPAGPALSPEVQKLAEEADRFLKQAREAMNRLEETLRKLSDQTRE